MVCWTALRSLDALTYGASTSLPDALLHHAGTVVYRLGVLVIIGWLPLAAAAVATVRPPRFVDSRLRFWANAGSALLVGLSWTAVGGFLTCVMGA